MFNTMYDAIPVSMFEHNEGTYNLLLNLLNNSPKDQTIILRGPDGAGQERLKTLIHYNVSFDYILPDEFPKNYVILQLSPFKAEDVVAFTEKFIKDVGLSIYLDKSALSMMYAFCDYNINTYIMKLQVLYNLKFSSFDFYSIQHIFGPIRSIGEIVQKLTQHGDFVSSYTLSETLVTSIGFKKFFSWLLDFTCMYVKNAMLQGCVSSKAISVLRGLSSFQQLPLGAYCDLSDLQSLRILFFDYLFSELKSGVYTVKVKDDVADMDVDDIFNNI